MHRPARGRPRRPLRPRDRGGPVAPPARRASCGERLEASDYTGAREAVARLAEAIERHALAGRASRRSGSRDVGDALAPDAYWRAKTWKRVAVIFAGPGANLILTVILFAFLFMAGGGKATQTIDEVVPRHTRRGDGSTGRRRDPRDRRQHGGPRRDLGDDLELRRRAAHRRPSCSDGDEESRSGRSHLKRRTAPTASASSSRGEGLGSVDSTWQAVRVTGIVTKEIGASVGRLVTGDGRDEISSPVGIVQGSSEAVEQGADTYLWVLGLISLSLALLNLLPLLPLDGGHIAFSLVEGIRGKAVAREVYERVSVGPARVGPGPRGANCPADRCRSRAR